jgi:hypothetical protein
MLLGLVVGILLGIVLHRSDFCMHSALRDVVNGRAGRSVRAYLVALAVQLAVVNALGIMGWLAIPLPAVTLIATSVGGLAFGVGMVLAKG